MPTVQVLVPHGRRVRLVQVDDAECRRLNTLTPPGFGFDIETWEAIEASPYPTGPSPGVVAIHFER